MMNENSASEEPKTLKELLNKKNSSVIIPLLQREYVQGGDENSSVRDAFLDYLKEKVEQDDGAELDFIYGYKRNDDFEPVDGQQRLTTLYLLHIYACIKEHPEEEDTAWLSNFSYGEREIADNFYSLHISKHENFCELHVSSHKDSGGSIPNQIERRASTFFGSDGNPEDDYTVQASLECLAALDERFADVEDLWGKLTAKRRLRFQVLGMETVGLDDRLYVKMNARGKELSPFERVKAEMEKQLADTDLAKSFSQKVDNEWRDLLWKWSGGAEKVDDAMIALFDNLARIYFLASVNDEDKKAIFPEISNSKGDVKIVTIKKFLEQKQKKNFSACFTGYVSYLEEVFDLYVKNQCLVDKLLSPFVACASASTRKDKDKDKDKDDITGLGRDLPKLYSEIEFFRGQDKPAPEEYREFLRMQEFFFSTDSITTQKNGKIKSVENYFNRNQTSGDLKVYFGRADELCSSFLESYKNSAAESPKDRALEAIEGTTIKALEAPDYVANNTRAIYLQQNLEYCRMRARVLLKMAQEDKRIELIETLDEIEKELKHFNLAAILKWASRQEKEVERSSENLQNLLGNRSMVLGKKGDEVSDQKDRLARLALLLTFQEKMYDWKPNREDTLNLLFFHFDPDYLAEISYRNTSGDKPFDFEEFLTLCAGGITIQEAYESRKDKTDNYPDWEKALLASLIGEGVLQIPGHWDKYYSILETVDSAGDPVDAALYFLWKWSDSRIEESKKYIFWRR